MSESQFDRWQVRQSRSGKWIVAQPRRFLWWTWWENVLVRQLTLDPIEFDTEHEARLAFGDFKWNALAKA